MADRIEAEQATQTPREIAFEDIKKGDDIEARSVRGGVTFTRRGIAHRLTYRDWYTEAGGVIASNYYDGWKHYLHHRPAPAEPKGLGAVVQARVPESGDGLWTLVRVQVEQGLAPWQGPGAWRFYWDDLDPDTIKELHGGIKVES